MRHCTLLVIPRQQRAEDHSPPVAVRHKCQIPITFAADPNPRPFLIPVGAPTVKFGFVFTNVSGYVPGYYHQVANYGLRTAEYIINSDGGIILNDGVGTPFYNASYIYSSTGNSTDLGLCCAKRMFDLGARTFAMYFDAGTRLSIAPAIEGAARSLGMVALVNTTTLSFLEQAEATNSGKPCSYLEPMIAEIVAKDPDLLLVSFGGPTDDFVRCLHEKLYHPRAMWLPTGSVNLTGDNLWQTNYMLQNGLLVSGAAFTDPLLHPTLFMSIVVLAQ